MNLRLSLALLTSLLLAACSDMPGKDAPIEDRGTVAKTGSAPVTDTQAGADASTQGLSAKAMTTTQGQAGGPGMEARGDAQAVVETRALPGAAPGQAAPVERPSAAVGAEAHKDRSGTLADRVIYFEFDSTVIAPRFQALLEAHANHLKAHRENRVILQGHADERGSREYNLALGQRRSESVRQALSLLGLPDEQMEAVSMGEEKPVAEGHDEAAWQLNRRVEILYQGE